MNIRTSPLVIDGSLGKRRTNWFVAWLLVVPVFIIGAQTITGALLKFPPESYASQWVELVTNLISLGLLWLWLHFWEKRPFSTVGFRHGRALPRFFAGFAGGIAAMAGASFVLVGLGMYSMTGSRHGTAGFSALLPVLLVSIVWIVQGSTEEILMRGFLLQNNALQLPGWLAILLVSFGFALIHMNFNPLILANITLVAVFFSFLSLAHGNIWAACGFHVAWNYAQGSLLGIPVSGNARDVSLLTLGPVQGAQAWLSGGEFGIEGSAVATLILAALSVWAFLYYRKIEAQRVAEEPVEVSTAPATA